MISGYNLFPIYAIHKPKIRPWERTLYESLAGRYARLQAARDHRVRSVKLEVIKANLRFMSILKSRRVAHGELHGEDAPFASLGSLKRKGMPVGGFGGPPLAKICMRDVRDAMEIHPGYSVVEALHPTDHAQMPAAVLGGSSDINSPDALGNSIPPSIVVPTECLRAPKKPRHESFLQRTDQLKMNRAIRSRTRLSQLKAAAREASSSSPVIRHRRRLAHDELHDIYECTPSSPTPKRKRASYGISKPDVAGYAGPAFQKLRVAYPLELLIDEAHFAPTYMDVEVDDLVDSLPYSTILCEMDDIESPEMSSLAAVLASLTISDADLAIVDSLIPPFNSMWSLTKDVMELDETAGCYFNNLRATSDEWVRDLMEVAFQYGETAYHSFFDGGRSGAAITEADVSTEINDIRVEDSDMVEMRGYQDLFEDDYIAEMLEPDPVGGVREIFIEEEIFHGEDDAALTTEDSGYFEAAPAIHIKAAPTIHIAEVDVQQSSEMSTALERELFGDDDTDSTDGSDEEGLGVIDPQAGSGQVFTSDSPDVLKIIQDAVASAILGLGAGEIGPELVAPPSSNIFALLGQQSPFDDPDLEKEDDARHGCEASVFDIFSGLF